MNFLAHAYLSFDYEPFIIGNMISDFVKGKKKYAFDDKIQAGIQLHRDIDTFTDEHPVIAQAKQVFRQKTGLYAGAFVDVAFDYFVANDLSLKTPLQWQQFSEKVYNVLSKNIHILPEHFLKILPWMVREDWLYNYRFKWGIENSFKHVTRRAKFLDNDLDVFADFEDNVDFLREKFNTFFPQLYLHVMDTVRELIREREL